MSPFTRHVCQCAQRETRGCVGESPDAKPTSPPTQAWEARVGNNVLFQAGRCSLRQSRERQAKLLEALLEKKEMCFQREGVWYPGPVLTAPRGREGPPAACSNINHGNPLFLSGGEQLPRAITVPATCVALPGPRSTSQGFTHTGHCISALPGGWSSQF